MSEQFVTVARLRAELADVLARLDPDEPVYVTQRGQPRAVLLGVERYRTLVKQIEYLDDAVEALLARDRRAAGEKSRPLAELMVERRAGPRRHARVSR